MTTVTRGHLAGLELALESGAVTSSDMRESVREMIAQASAAPEQEAVAVAIYSDAYQHQEEWMRTKPFALVVGEEGVSPHLQRRIPGFQDVTITYTNPCAELERLRAENKRLDLALAQADHNYDCDRQQFEQKLADAQALLRTYDQPIRVAIKMLERTLSPTAMEIALELKRCLGDSCDFLSATAQPADTGCSACACGSTEPHSTKLGCIKAAGDAYHGKTAQPAEVKS